MRGYFGHAALDPSGKIYVTGYFEWGFSFPAPKIDVVARLFPNGSRDFAFHPTLPAELLEARGVVVEPDGKVVVLGQYESPATRSWMVRLHPDGSPDPGFTLDPSLGVVTARPLQRDPSGTYLLATGTQQDQLVRIDSSGTLDPGFSATSLWTDHPTGTPEPGYFGNFTTSPSGKIYSGSGFDSVDGVSTVKLVAFEGDPLPAGLAWSFTAPSVVENNGAITLSVVRTGPLAGPASVAFSTTAGSAGAGDFTATSGTLDWPAGSGGARSLTIPVTQDALAEGDESFTVTLSAASGAPIAGPATVSVTLLDDEAAPVIVTPPDSLAVKEGEGAGFSVVVSSPVPATYQWRKDGADIPGATSASHAIAAAAPGDAADYTVVVTTPAGSAISSAATLTVVPPAALPDPAFSLTGVTTPGPFRMLPDGTLLILDGTSFAGYTLRKLDADFTADPSFSVTTTPASGFPASSAFPSPLPLPDGRFIATGNFSAINGVARNRVARLDASGTVDTSFDPFFGAESFEVNGFTAYFSNLAGVAVTGSGTVYAMVRTSNQGSRLFRLLDDGSADPSFDTAYNYGTSAYLYALTELPDGSLLIGYTAGGFGSFDRGLRRVLPDGSFDPGFPLFDTSGNVTGIALLGDGRFAAIHGTQLTIHGLADGSLLETHGFTGTLTSIQPYRGRLLLTGPTAFGTTPLPGLALFSPGGGVDGNFPGGAGPNSDVIQAVIDSQERILVRGGFTTWNGAAAPGFARLLVDNPELGFATSAARVIENEGSLEVTLVRYGDSSSSASVRVASTGGTAASPDDFTAVDQTVTWAAGDDAPKTLTLTLVDDAELEGEETFALQLSDPVGAVLAPGGLTITLRDDEALPRITTQPAPVFAVLGKPASFSVVATSPTPLGYQWHLDGAPISGATAETYSIASVSPADEGAYTVRITNDEDTVTSLTAPLIIIPDPAGFASGFAPPTPLTGAVFALAPAPGGGAYVGGQFQNVGGDPDRDYLVKLLPDGSLDTSFTPPLLGGTVRDIAVQPDGKIIAVGQFTSVAGTSLRRIVRLEATGALDTDFTANAGAGTNGDILAVALDADGSILLGGSFSSWNNGDLGTGDDLIRLGSDGTLQGKVYFDFTTQVLDLLVLPEGDLLAAYNTTSSSAAKVRRYKPDLILDNSLDYGSGRTKVERMALAASGNFLFAGPNGLFEVDAAGATVTTFPGSGYQALARQVNGKVIAGGSFGSRLFRYLPDGSQDPSFELTTNPNGNVQALALHDDGTLWTGGSFTTFNGTAVNYVARLNGDPIPLALTSQPAPLTITDPGTDVTLSASAVGTTAISYQWFLDGTPLADGPGISGSQGATLSLTGVDDEDAGDYRVEVTNEAGTLASDTATVVVLGAPEIVSLSEGADLLEGGTLSLEVEAFGAATLAYQWFRDGTPLPGQTAATLTIAPVSESDAGSYTVEASNGIGSITSDPVPVTVAPNAAALAPGFTPPTVTGGVVTQVLPLPGGRVLVGGSFSSISDGSSTSGARLAVVDEGGAVVPVAGLSADGAIEGLRLQSDGRILLAGGFSTINGSPRAKLARLETDLSLDETFAPTGLGSIFGARDLAEESGGTLIAVGDFFDFGGEPGTAYAVRLNQDGSYNDSFTSGADNRIYRVFPQSDGDLVFAGWFGNWASSGEGYIVRTDSSGTLDSGTDYAVSFFNVGDALQLSNGDLLAANAFTNGIVRLAPDGSAVTPFPSTGGFSGLGRAFAETPSGELLIGGDITFAADQPAGRLVRLDADGNRDPDFDTGSGFDSSVHDVAVSESGRIWVGGGFSTYNGIPATNLVLLKGDAGSPADPFDAFVSGLPADLRGEDDDADFDGFPNLVELPFGTDPGSAASSPDPLATGGALAGATLNADYGLALDPAKTYRLVKVTLPKDRLGVTIELEASASLSFDGDASATQVGTPVDHGSTETRRYLITPAIEDAPEMFWRLTATR